MGILMEATDVSCRGHPQLFAMTSPSEIFETVHTIAINTRETEFGSIVQPIPITIKAYKQFNGHPINEYYPQQMLTALTPLTPAPRVSVTDCPSAMTSCLSPIMEIEEKPREKDTSVSTVRPPPKKKWIKEYLEEEPRPPSPVAVRVLSTARNGVVRPPTPPPHAPPSLFDYVEHSRPRTNGHGPQQVPSPPSVSSSGSSGSSGSGSAPRAGTREVHNKLEKNRRAHLKECFELLKRQLPATQDDKKASNLAILGSAIRYIQVLRRKERECEHEMERLAREKIAAQQRVAALKRDVTVRAAGLTSRPTTESEERKDEKINGQVLGIPISITSSPPHPVRMDSPPRTLNLSTKLRPLPIQITSQPTAAQVVRTSYGARHNTLTLTTLAPADNSSQNCQPGENGVNGTLSSLMHPAQIHLPISQVVGNGGLVVGGALQLVSTSSGLRVVQSPLHTNGVTTGESNRIPKENGLVSSMQNGDHTGVLVNGLPLVVSQPAAHLLHSHTLAHKMLETQAVKGTPLGVSAQYLSATTIVKPVVVVSSAPPT